MHGLAAPDRSLTVAARICMLFNSFTFAAFFALVYGLYLLSMRRLRLQNTILLAASYVFYGWWDWRFLGLIVLSTVTDFACGWAIDRRQRPPRGTGGSSPTRGDATSAIERRDAVSQPASPYRHSPQVRRSCGPRELILFISVAMNLGILGIFKYFDFFVTSCAGFLTAIGLPLQPWLLDVVLPVGISFYTFQTLSYTIDVYRGKLRATKNLIDFALFVGFFPQLVAGPIVRATEFLPQVSRPRRLNLSTVYEGGYLIIWGLFKKVVIADNLAVLVDTVFSANSTPLGGAVLVAVYAFAVQIYCDFSGYSDIARGCAKMMGFEIRLNFNLPYFATNPVEFWRRWHMSLSSWLRDYLYIPLGGNRKGPRRTCLHLMLTMILGGLWHGAAWTFVLWGVYQGLLLVGYQIIQPQVERWFPAERSRFPTLRRWLAVVVFFHFVCFGWLIFRAESVQQIGSLLASIATPWAWWILCGANTLRGTGVFTLLGYALPLFVMQLAQLAKGDLAVLLRAPVWVRGLSYAAMFYGLVLFGGRVDKPFIYFQF